MLKQSQTRTLRAPDSFPTSIRQAEELEARITTWARNIQIRETDRALKRLGFDGGREREAVLQMVERVCSGVLSPVVETIRLAGKRGDMDLLRTARELFPDYGR